VAVLRFEWDDRKNSQNRRRQGVSFEEAQTVFFDEQALLVADRDHSEHEEPFILLGLWSARCEHWRCAIPVGERGSTHFRARES